MTKYKLHKDGVFTDFEHSTTSFRAESSGSAILVRISREAISDHLRGEREPSEHEMESFVEKNIDKILDNIEPNSGLITEELSRSGTTTKVLPINSSSLGNFVK
jgi:hypothetical protein